MTHQNQRVWSFDLERAIATWRRFVSREESINPVDLDELEIHLRDEWDALCMQGNPPEKAFLEARRRLGDYATLEAAYREVDLEKRIRKGSISMEIQNRIGLATSYFQTAWRNVLRHKGYAVLNIGGLSLALASALIIGVFIRHSLSFDRFHEDADRTYRLVMSRGDYGSNPRVSDGVASLVRDFPQGVDTVTELSGSYTYEIQITVEEEHFMMPGIMSVDDRFFDVFDFDVLRSTSRNPLEAPRRAVLTESTARRLFGNVDPLGKTFRYNASRDYTVTGIVADPPTNTHLPFNILLRAYTEPREVRWSYFGARTYIRMDPGADTAPLVTYLDERFKEAQPGAIGSFWLQPITDIYLHSGTDDEYAPVGDIRYLYVFGTIGILILVLAGINYMNLATARASRRAREVGVRKVVGATRAQLRRQFLVESLLLSLLSIPVALLMARGMLPLVNSVTGEAFAATSFADPIVASGLLLLVILVALGSGLYPALIMSRHNPVRVFAGARSAGRGRHSIRRTLVGIQVAVSFGIIVATLLVFGQLRFIQQQNLGFNKDQVVVFSPRGWDADDLDRFRTRVVQNGSLESVSTGSPLGIGWRSMTWKKKDEASGVEHDFEAIYVGANFFDTMGMDLEEGRLFTEEDASKDPPPAIVTRSYARLSPKGESVIGRKPDTDAAGEIVGVVNDFQNFSFHDTSPVTMFVLEPDVTSTIVARLSANHIPDGLKEMEAAWDEITPERPFVYYFLDDHIEQQYVAEKRLARVFGLFAGLSILIASIGLFGLAAFTAQQRVKEIGIRKSLGATMQDIVLLLSKEFVVIVVAGSVAVTPLVFIYGRRWLESFTDHIPLGPGLFLSAGAACLAFVLIAVGYQAVKAASTNPVEALRND